MKERGMIFNGEMVRAILDGRKTQTRRIIKNQYEAPEWSVKPALAPRTKRHTHDWWLPTGTRPYSALPGCPYGLVGDRIWVRETFSLLGNEDACPVDWDDNIVNDKKDAARIYKASCWQKPNNYGLWSIPDRETEFEGAWTPSIHMPRWASRITLEITNVRVERLNAISEEDARVEGIIDGGCLNCGEPEPCGCANPEPDATDAFACLWQSIYGQENWNANPWVWVIEFKRIEGGEA